MSALMTPRQWLDQADAHRRTVQAAEWAMTKIRLSEKPLVTGGRVWFRRERETDRELAFTGEETAAIYLALRIVKQDEARKAADCEAQVTTTDGAR